MHRRWRLAAVAWVIVVLALTLSPGDISSDQPDLTPWYCLVCGPTGGADVFQNILLLMPLGFALAAAGTSLRLTAATVVLLPLGIELAQLMLPTGRDAALGDLLANSGGGTLGWIAGRRRDLLARPDSRVAAPVVLGIFVIQLLVTTILTRPMPTGTGPLRWQLNPESGRRPTYRGEIHRISFRGATMIAAPGRDANPVEIPHGGPAAYSVLFAWDRGSGTTLSPIARLDDADGRAVVSVDRRGASIGLSMRTTAAALKLRQPTVVVPVPAVAQGAPLLASMAIGNGMITAAVAGSDDSVAVAAPFGAQHGWTLINPFTPAVALGPDWRGWTAAWLFGWGLILGWSLRTAGAAARSAWVAAAVILLVLMVRWSGAGPGPTEPLGLGAGLLTAISGWRSRRTRAGA